MTLWELVKAASDGFNTRQAGRLEDQATPGTGIPIHLQESSDVHLARCIVGILYDTYDTTRPISDGARLAAALRALEILEGDIAFLCEHLSNRYSDLLDEAVERGE